MSELTSLKMKSNLRKTLMNVLLSRTWIYLREHIIRQMCRGSLVHRSNYHNSRCCSWISLRFRREMLIRLFKEWEQRINLGRRKILCFQEDMHCHRINKRNRLRMLGSRVVRIKEILAIMAARIRFHQGFTMISLFISRNKNVSWVLVNVQNYIWQNQITIM